MAGRRPMVTAVICTAFDEATDTAVYAVRETVRAAGVPMPDRPPHRPHFRLAAARLPRGELDRVVTVAEKLAGRHAPISLRLDEVGRFGRAGVVWLGPAARHTELDALQRDTDTALQAAGWPPAFGERSDPRRWIAHCTLATRVAKPKLREVQRAVQESYQPISARIDALAVILVGGRGDTALLPLRG